MLQKPEQLCTANCNLYGFSCNGSVCFIERCTCITKTKQANAMNWNQKKSAPPMRSPQMVYSLIKSRITMNSRNTRKQKKSNLMQNQPMTTVNPRDTWKHKEVVPMKIPPMDGDFMKNFTRMSSDIMSLVKKLIDLLIQLMSLLKMVLERRDFDTGSTRYQGSHSQALASNSSKVKQNSNPSHYHAGSFVQGLHFHGHIHAPEFAYENVFNGYYNGGSQGGQGQGSTRNNGNDTFFQKRASK